MRFAIQMVKLCLVHAVHNVRFVRTAKTPARVALPSARVKFAGQLSSVTAIFGGLGPLLNFPVKAQSCSAKTRIVEVTAP
ncbi:hypothetical protein IscW_ISCW000700, partial [Ixodes scapularis]